MKNLFDLSGKTFLITGAGGLLGIKHAEAIIEQGGRVIMTDWHLDRCMQKTEQLRAKYTEDCAYAFPMDVCDVDAINKIVDYWYRSGYKIDGLINNCAKDPKITKDSSLGEESRFENMTEEYFNEGISAIIHGTFLCSQVLCKKFLEQGHGVIVNIASDLSVIAPDQRIYEKPGKHWHEQPVKPITYSAAKYAVVGMTKYLASYFAKKNIRVNCLSPTGVYNNHPEEFVERLSSIIPMGRMAGLDEYKGAIAFLCSDASSYMTGHNLIIDGGKTIW